MYSIITFLKIEEPGIFANFVLLYTLPALTVLSMSRHSPPALTAVFKPKSRSHFNGFTVTAKVAYSTLGQLALQLCVKPRPPLQHMPRLLHLSVSRKSFSATLSHNDLCLFLVNGENLSVLATLKERQLATLDVLC
jgi:hypothetical protein